ncbi:MAG: ATP-binding protein [Acidobacteria bacterium]|nr:MAG: ATP-binding protein [Acidobacteriota bacterium]
MGSYPLVAIRSFIESARDSGYKGTSAAIAELVDNSFEADAKTVDISVSRGDGGAMRLSVADDGAGMPAGTMQLALQFGGSTRFGSRLGAGRYGMGLPNSCLSQARRVDVESWTSPHNVWATYLDVDAIASGSLRGVPVPVRILPDHAGDLPACPSGTRVTLTRCDRLDFQTVRPQARRLRADLGRIFRQRLYDGGMIRVNGDLVDPFDPLFLREGSNLTGAEAYGPPLAYEVSASGGESARSLVTVRFSVLPIERWCGLPNSEKNRLGIAKAAGVSVLRAGREIDRGWYFMGSKRKENYDDWWRCEVAFTPELDEMFGVTHTKQTVNPRGDLSDILVPDVEQIARKLNAEVRRRYLSVRKGLDGPRSVSVAGQRDHLMQPISTRGAAVPDVRLRGSRLGYVIDETAAGALSFYVPSIVRDRIKVALNRDHNFYRKVYGPLLGAGSVDAARVLERLQLLLLAAARAECALRSGVEREIAEKLRRSWSNALTAFLD